MDGVSAAASAIAIVQAGGMLLQVGKAFHETFITKDNDNRAEDSALRVASIGEFIQKIDLFQAVKLLSSPTVPNSTTKNTSGAVAEVANPQGADTSTPSGTGLDVILSQCRTHLERLQGKVQKMIVPQSASKMKRFIGAIRLKLNEPEFVQIESTIIALLQQLTLFISLAQFQLSQNSDIASRERHDEFLQKHQELETHIQVASQEGVDQQYLLLSELQRIMEDQQMRLDAKILAFEQSNQMILSSFERLAISPRFDRSSSGLSGTTMIPETDAVDDGDLLTPIAPCLMQHPGFGFRADRLSEPKIAKSLLDRIDDFLSPNNQSETFICINTSNHEDALHDTCNCVVQEIAGSGLRLLCYNGLPRDGPPPARGWYTMTHVIWWLTAQLLIPVPHQYGHMPSHGYVPNIEAIIERLEKQSDTTTYMVFYLLTRSCLTSSDQSLYELLLSRLNNISKTSNIRVLLFSDDLDDPVLAGFPQNSIVVYPEGEEEFSIAEWEPTLINETVDEGNSDDDVMLC